jgi:hypothetical protein
MPTDRGKRYRLETTGMDTRAAGAHQRALSRIGADIDEVETSVDAYTPGTASDWAGDAPTSLREAVDRCATLLKALNAGTGP